MPTDSERFLETQRLQDKGVNRCHGLCKRILPVDDLLIISFRNTIATCVCLDCFEQLDLKISMKSEGLNLQLVQKGPIILSTK